MSLALSHKADIYPAQVNRPMGIQLRTQGQGDQWGGATDGASYSIYTNGGQMADFSTSGCQLWWWYKHLFSGSGIRSSISWSVLAFISNYSAGRESSPLKVPGCSTPYLQLIES